MVRTVSPVAELLDQWLLLPIFLKVGLVVLLLRRAGGRVGALLALLLCTLTLHDLTYLWPGSHARAVPALSTIEAPLVALFTLAYAAGRHVAGRRIWRAPFFLLPGPIVLAEGNLAGWAPSHPAYLIHAAAFYALAGVFLYMGRSETSLSGVEPQLIGAGLTLLFVGGPLLDAALPVLGLSLLVFPYASAAASAVLASLVLRYKSFSPRPAAEGAPPTPGGAIDLPPGVYLAAEDAAPRARSLFLGAVRGGAPGLLISHTHPLSLRAATGLKTVPIIWLAQPVYERSLPPAQTDVLLHTVRDYIGQTERSVVLIEDLDYIVTNAGLFATHDLLRDLAGAAERAGAVVLLSSTHLTMEERQGILQLGVASLD